MLEKKAFLTKSTTAVRDDIIIKQASKVIGRMQVKDTAKSISKTIKQVADGKYNRTLLVGTKETTVKYTNATKAARLTQKMKSSGISSSDTARIASKALGQMPTKAAIASAARSAGAWGAAISAGVEVISSGQKLMNGEISGGEFAVRVAKEGVGGGISGATAGVAGTIATGGAAIALSTVSAPAWVPVAVGVGAAVAVGSAVKGAWDWLWD